jgi:hypothetical protein
MEPLNVSIRYIVQAHDADDTSVIVVRTLLFGHPFFAFSDEDDASRGIALARMAHSRCPAGLLIEDIGDYREELETLSVSCRRVA